MHAWNDPERRREHFFAAFLNLFRCAPPAPLRFRLRGIFPYLGIWSPSRIAICPGAMTVSLP
jgi:hypothetical protein